MKNCMCDLLSPYAEYPSEDRKSKFDQEQELAKNLGFGNTGGDQRHQTPPANTAARVPPGDLAREQLASRDYNTKR